MQQHKYHVKSRHILGDLLTPVSTYLKVRDLYPQSALMESSDYHGNDNSRSFIALNPMASIEIGHGRAKASSPDGTNTEQNIDDTCRTEDVLNGFLNRFAVEGEYSQYCGLYGFTSFNAIRYFEHIPIKDSVSEKNDAPDLIYILYKQVIVFDHFNNSLTLLELVSEGEEDGLEELEKMILNRKFTAYSFRPIGEITSTLTDEEHKSNIRKGIAHCMRGDVFQIVLSRRFIQRFEGDDFNLYRTLRHINPSPYLFYFDFGGFRIFGSSPETHCKIENGKAYIDPIAGTTKRTGNKETDQKNAEYLRHDPKENAEHVMLVDLARNDLSRNCDHVQVEFYKDMQYYSHVIHLVSRVSGQLLPQSNAIKTFIDTFPAGTLSGAPKVKAMELISQYEPHNRGAYGGCIGFIGLNGDLNQAITIRTFVSRNQELWFQAGGGIVAQSNEEYELQEINNKLGALRKAIEQAGKIS